MMRANEGLVGDEAGCLASVLLQAAGATATADVATTATLTRTSASRSGTVEDYGGRTTSRYAGSQPAPGVLRRVRRPMTDPHSTLSMRRVVSIAR